MSAYAFTSIPPWAVPAAETSPAGMPAGGSLGVLDPAARAWLLVGIGGRGAAQVDAWARGCADVPARSITGRRAVDVQDRLGAALAETVVGVRVGLAGPAGDCLVLRGQLTSAGLEDDELVVVPTGAGTIDVFCAHCQQVTSAVAAVGDVVACAHCGLGLLVYYHVSRRTGRFLGFQADAESPQPTESGRG